MGDILELLLKPCPECDCRTPVLARDTESGDGRVVCPECGCQGEWWPDPAAAIAEWNEHCEAAL